MRSPDSGLFAPENTERSIATGRPALRRAVTRRFPYPPCRGSTRATVRQLAVLRMIYGYTRSHGYPPRVTEIASAFGIASGADTHLIALERKGYLTRGNHQQKRTIALTDRGRFVCEPVRPLPEMKCTWCGTSTFDTSLPCSGCSVKRGEA